MLNLKLNKTQMTFIRSKERLVLLCGGLGSGKSYAGAVWAVIQSIKHKGMVGLVGAQNPAQLATVVLKTLIPLLDSAGIGWVYGEEPPWGGSRFPRHSNILSLSNGSQIVCRSLHASGADRNLRGLELAWAWLDECRDMEPGVFDIVHGRLRGFGQDAPYSMRLTSTPNGRDWLWERFAGPDRMPGSLLLRMKTSSNRHLPSNYETSLRETMSKEMAAQELDAEFVSQGTNQCYRFDRDKHVKPCRPSSMPSFMELVFTLDFNVSHMTGNVLLLDRKSGMAFAIDEVRLESRASTREACAEFGRRWSAFCRSCSWMGDEAGTHADTRGNETDLDIMKNELARWFDKRTALNDGSKPLVKDRIGTVNSMLDPAIGEPRLIIDPSCKELIKDLEKLRWTPEHKVDKSDPERSHAADATGYALHRLFPMGRPRGPVVGGVN